MAAEQAEDAGGRAEAEVSGDSEGGEGRERMFGSTTEESLGDIIVERELRGYAGERERRDVYSCSVERLRRTQDVVVRKGGNCHVDNSTATPNKHP